MYTDRKIIPQYRQYFFSQEEYIPMKTVPQSGVITIDLHGKNTYQVGVTVDAMLRRAGSGTYRLRLIHGHHGGTAIRDFLRENYTHHPKVRRILVSPDGGTTELVLREY